MALLAEVKHDVAPGTPQTTAVTYSAGHWTAAPSLVFHIASQCTPTEIKGGADISFGFSDGTTVNSIQANGKDALATSSTIRGISNQDLQRSLIQPSTEVETTSISSLAINSTSLAWDIVSGNSETFAHLALGGDDIEQVHIAEIAIPSTSSEVYYTAPGFRPDFLVATWIHGSGGLYQLSSGSYWGIGFSDGSSDACTQVTSLNNQATSNSRSLLVDEFVSVYSTAGPRAATGTVTSFGASGYTINWSRELTTTAICVILAVKGPQAKVVRGLQPTTDITVRHDAGFAPRASLSLLSMKTESVSSTEDARAGLGFWAKEGSSQGCVGYLEENGQATTDTDAAHSNVHAIKNYNHEQTVVGQATLSVDGDELVETWENTDGTTYAHAHLILGAAPVVDGGAGDVKEGIDYTTEDAVTSLFTDANFIDDLHRYLGLDPTLDAAYQPIDVTDLLHTAIHMVEKDQWRVILPKTVALKLPYQAFCAQDKKVFLPYGQITSITSFTWTDADGAEQSLTSGTDYTLYDQEPSFLWAEQWLTVMNDLSTTHPTVATVSYTAGYTSFAKIPRGTLQAIKTLCYYLFNNRGLDNIELPMAYKHQVSQDMLNNRRCLEFI